MKSPESRYQRFVSYGLGHLGYKSAIFERRSKRSFRRWLRRKGDERHDHLLTQDWGDRWDSLPLVCENPECPDIGRCGGRCAEQF